MLTELKYIPEDVSVLLVYLKDDEVLDEIIRCVRQRYMFNAGYVCDAANLNDLHSKQKDALLKPLLGDRWLIRANIDDIAPDALFRCLFNLNGNGFYVYYTHKYSIYNKLIHLDKVRNSPCVRGVYGASFTSKDMYTLYAEKCTPQALKPAVLNFIVKQYRRDCGKFLRILQAVVSGVEIKTQADVVQLVGLGALTLDSYLFDLLRTEVKPTARSRNLVLHRWVRMFYDLKQAYPAPALVRLLQHKLDAVLTVKLLQVEGLVIGNRVEIPEELNTPAVQGMLRYSTDISERVSVPEILWLRQALNSAGDRTYVTDNSFCEILYALVERRCSASVKEATV